MIANPKWGTMPDKNKIDSTISALKEKGVNVSFVQTEDEAKRLVLSIIPKGSEVFTVTSTTLGQLGIDKALDESSDVISVHKRITAINDKGERLKARQLAGMSEYVLGSVHAVTTAGELVIASQSGSQLAPYVYDAKKLIFVIGVQKIVDSIDDAIKRVYEYSYPLEDERAKRVYGVGSAINKILIINKEPVAGRIAVIFVNRNVGF